MLFLIEDQIKNRLRFVTAVSNFSLNGIYNIRIHQCTITTSIIKLSNILNPQT